MLEVAIASLFLWFITGFNIVEGGVPIIGIQWSTFSTFALFWYLMMLNLQYGGIRTLNQFLYEIDYDFRMLWPSLIHPWRSRKKYHSGDIVDGLRATTMATLICLGALFLFEVIWVPLYDYFQFGVSWEWPVYFALTKYPVWARNFGDAAIFLVVGALILAWAYEGKDMHRRFSYSFRIDRYWAFILVITAGMWVLWIFFPAQQINTAELSSGQVLGQLASTYSQYSCYIFPSQHLFPQNTYTFYPCSILGKEYAVSQILGFFNPDNWLHLLNVVTKYATFLAVCYPCMVRVERA